jgi:hypothetical protein
MDSVTYTKNGRPKHVYVRKGRFYFERKDAGCHRLHGELGSEQFESEYLDIMRKLAAAKHIGLVTPDGQDHFISMERQARLRATKYGREFTLPKGWMRAQYEAQSGKCAITGRLMVKDRHRHAPWAPSIDRLDSTKGYTPDNCRLIGYILNCAKNQFTERELIDMCRAVVSRRGMGKEAA